MNIKILTVIFSLFFSNLYAAGTDSGDSAKTNYGKDYKSAIKLIRSKDYDNSLSQNEKFGSDNMQYLKNCEKIMVVDTKKKERFYKYIETNIISLTKQNLNDMAKFKFYI